jgi:hypothetical protein
MRRSLFRVSAFANLAHSVLSCCISTTHDERIQHKPDDAENSWCLQAWEFLLSKQQQSSVSELGQDVDEVKNSFLLSSGIVLGG